MAKKGCDTKEIAKTRVASPGFLSYPWMSYAIPILIVFIGEDSHCKYWLCCWQV